MAKTNFAELLKRSRELQEKKQKAQAADKKKEADRLLYATGLTKKLAEKAERSHEQILQDAEKAIGDVPLAQPQVIDLAAYHDLPSTMMDDKIVLDKDQQAAVDGLRNQKYGCLIGSAGTGKTTTVKRLISALESSVPTIDLNDARVESQRNFASDLNVAICFCSFTGRAVQQLKRAIPEHYHPLANTIHATLGYMPTIVEYEDKETGEWKEKRIFKPTFTEFNKLPFKICIVDESGTVPIDLWDNLIKALPDDCRIILIGDINQLPPVQGRSVLPFAMLQWPTYTLTKIHRQAADNPIIANAHRVLSGKLPIQDNGKFIVKDVGDGSIGALNTTIAVLQTLHKNSKFQEMHDAFIVPQNKGSIGQWHFNEKLVHYFNKLRKDDTGIPVNPRKIITAGYQHVAFAVGDKVMILNNERQLGLTNGMVGVVTEINQNNSFKGIQIADGATKFEGDVDLTDLEDEINDAAENIDEQEKESERQASHIMHVKFQNVDNPVQFSTAGQYRKIAHAYAFTCHKSQGGEYPTVVILAHSANLRMLTREWLYTAITRAQERVILLCNRRGLIHAVNNQMIKGNSIAEKADRFIALMDKADTRLPILPASETIKAKPFKGVI